MNLCLGTVQFGMDYGIRGQKKPPLADALDILDYAAQNGISHFDTAYAYGSAEDVMGAFLRRHTISRDRLFISAKLKPNIMDGVAVDDYYRTAKSNLEDSLVRMGTDYVDAYMCHSARYVYDEAVLDAMHRLKDEGLAKHVGVSVYEPDEAKACILNDKTDFMQLPFSIFDQRMMKEHVFETLTDAPTEINSRSAFIQGLILMGESEVPDFLSAARPIVSKIDALCARHGISRIALAMGFVKRQTAISHLVFGVDSLEQLKEDIAAFSVDLDQDIVDDISNEFRDIAADIVMPSLWKKG